MVALYPLGYVVILFDSLTNQKVVFRLWLFLSYLHCLIGLIYFLYHCKIKGLGLTMVKSHTPKKKVAILDNI